VWLSKNGKVLKFPIESVTTVPEGQVYLATSRDWDLVVTDDGNAEFRIRQRWWPQSLDFVLGPMSKSESLVPAEPPNLKELREEIDEHSLSPFDLIDGCNRSLVN
jgi:hypothetical protein